LFAPLEEGFAALFGVVAAERLALLVLAAGIDADLAAIVLVVLVLVLFDRHEQALIGERKRAPELCCELCRERIAKQNGGDNQDDRAESSRHD
jgi:hypothetical protein